ncbi:MAG: RNA polymerase sigma factor RpoD/SigA [Gemmataceae bacterium]|nr:RNA polymerase sigma factor RpoD/SigA [Gemmataceae bacterium]
MKSAVVSARRPRTTPRTTLSAYFEDVNETPLLSAFEERELAYRVQDGDSEARDQFIRANLRLVIKIAKQFASRGVTFEDLVQEGTLGLVRAVEAFDPERNTRFSTYAKFWIMQSIQRLLKGAHKSIHIPSYAADLVSKWRRTAMEIREQTGRTPCEEEIAKRLELRPKQVKIIKKALQIYQGQTQAETEEGDRAAWDLVPDHKSVDPDSLCIRSDDIKQMLRLVDTLEPREATVLKLRFGLSGGEPMNLSEIGRQLFLTRERVRQLQLQALESLRQRME